MHDQSIAAISNNYPRSINTQIVICAHQRRAVAAGQCWPGNRNDVVIARATVAHLLTGGQILGDGGNRGIASITTPRRDQNRPHHRDDHHRAHRRITARIEHVIARLKDWQILRQCRRRGGHTIKTINHSLQNIAEPWNLKPTTNYRSTPRSDRRSRRRWRR